jgi:hypothetical protein
MDVLDVFSRTFYPLAAQTGIPMRTLRRHLQVYRRYTDGDDSTMLVSRCARAARPDAGPYLMLLTREQLVVTKETGYIRHPRVYLQVPVSQLQAVTWTADPDGASVDLAMSTPRGRERFSIQALYARQTWRLDVALGRVFRKSAAASRFAAYLSPA